MAGEAPTMPAVVVRHSLDAVAQRSVVGVDGDLDRRRA